jgi:hypothetical protein
MQTNRAPGGASHSLGGSALCAAFKEYMTVDSHCLYRPDDDGSTYLWNVGRHSIKNTAVHLRRFWTSSSTQYKYLPLKPLTSHGRMLDNWCINLNKTEDTTNTVSNPFQTQSLTAMMQGAETSLMTANKATIHQSQGVTHSSHGWVVLGYIRVSYGTEKSAKGMQHQLRQTCWQKYQGRYRKHMYMCQARQRLKKWTTLKVDLEPFKT